MTHVTSQPLPLHITREIRECGFYPELVLGCLADVVGAQEVHGHLVHYEATFTGREVQRHMNVLVLTAKQLIIVHADDSDQGDPNRALASAEAVALRAIHSVAITRSVAHPEAQGGELVEVWLSLGWGANRRLDVGPASCEDPQCTADHGWSGMVVSSDLTVRMSPAGDGHLSTQKLLAFGALLQGCVG